MTTFAFKIPVSGFAKVHGEVIIEAASQDEAIEKARERQEDFSHSVAWEIDDYGDYDNPKPEVMATLLGSRVTGARYHVNVYKTDQAYGGPEEGGWWFSVGELMPDLAIEAQVKTRTFPQHLDRESAEVVRDKVQEWLDAEQNAHRNADLSSVNCEGRFVAIIETHAGQSWPQRKPHYC